MSVDGSPPRAALRPYQLSACLEYLFTEVGTYHERIRAAADQGLTAVELWGWRAANLPAITRALGQTSMSLTSLVTDPLSRLVDPAAAARWLAGLRESVAVAAELGAPYLVVVSGDRVADVPRHRQRLTMVESLTRAADMVAHTPVTLLLEPLHSVRTTSFLDRTDEAVDIVREIGSPAVRVLYDVYHSVMMGESPPTVLAGRMDQVAHVQIADVPDRAEPGAGGVDWPATLAALRAFGYTGRIGLEYRPRTATAVSLRAVEALLAAG